jgi:hypothetical protein
LFARVAKVARRRLGVPVLRDEPPDHRAAVFVAGSGRSGTTWLSELLLSGTQRRYVFEPLSRHVPQTAVFHRDLVKLYLRPDGEYPEHVAAMRDVLTGRVRNRWTERFNRRIVAEGRLVKEIRANLLLGWLQTNFPGMPIVLLLRHPCAVAASFVREGWVGRLGDLLAQPDLVADHLTGTQVELLARLDVRPRDRALVRGDARRTPAGPAGHVHPLLRIAFRGTGDCVRRAPALARTRGRQ